MTHEESLVIIKQMATSIQVDFDNRIKAIEAVRTVETALTELKTFMDTAKAVASAPAPAK